MIERFFLTLKQECVWLHRFENRDHAFRVVADWLDRYTPTGRTRRWATSRRRSTGSN